MLMGAQDYLSAPMPFLMGLHAPNLFMSTLRSSCMEETVVVDLDRGTVTSGVAAAGAGRLSSGAAVGPGAGSGQRGASGSSRLGSQLPWAQQLEAALELLHQTLRSPIEYESTPVIAQLMQVSPPFNCSTGQRCFLCG